MENLINVPSGNLPLVNEMMEVFADYLRIDTANGDASEDTLKTYHSHIGDFINWMAALGRTPSTATKDDIKAYRRFLIEERKLKPASISLKLSVVRRFYQAAFERRMITENPALGVNPPREKSDPGEKITFLEEVELQQLLNSVPKDGEIKNLRDRAMIALMAMEGPRTVEMHRVNIGDLIRQGRNWSLKVEGKRNIRRIPLRADIVKIIFQYLEAMKNVGYSLDPESPLFVSTGNRAGGKRISRRSIRRLVDFYLTKTDLKHTEGRVLSTHSLRHTAGTLGIRNGADLRQVQDLLGHKDPKTTAIYAHAADRHKKNPANAIGVNI